MQKDNRFFDDIAKAASDAAGGLLGMKREIEELISVQIEKLLQKMNLSTKEELDTALAMLTKIREEQENIKKRLDILEKGPR
ncbi:MAG: accessory factor UbiK family protein [Alphaproteobacteria bacterium]|nr:accessory factor UbiK family protein [Alphaproteobacteria bacterium]